MLIVKLSLLSCAFYLGFALLAEAAFYAIGVMKDGFAYAFTSRGWLVLSGIVWLLSTSAAFRIVSSGIRARLRG